MLPSICTHVWTRYKTKRLFENKCAVNLHDGSNWRNTINVLHIIFTLETVVLYSKAGFTRMKTYVCAMWLYYIVWKYAHNYIVIIFFSPISSSSDVSMW